MKNENNIPRLPDAELEIMTILWKYDRPLKIIDIYNELQSIRPISKATVHGHIEALKKRGFINIEFSPDKRSYKLLTPLISEDAYRTAEAESFIDRVCGGKWQKLIAALTASNKLTEDEVGELRQLLNKKGE